MPELLQVQHILTQISLTGSKAGIQYAAWTGTANVPYNSDSTYFSFDPAKYKNINPYTMGTNVQIGPFDYPGSTAVGYDALRQPQQSSRPTTSPSTTAATSSRAKAASTPSSHRIRTTSSWCGWAPTCTAVIPRTVIIASCAVLGAIPLR